MRPMKTTHCGITVSLVLLGQICPLTVRKDMEHQFSDAVPFNIAHASLQTPLECKKCSL